jgi:hypothetical protein
VVLVDVLIGMFWTGTTFEERGRMHAQYEYASQDLAAEEASPYHSRYGALHFLSWLTRGWPESEGATVGRQLLGGWLNGRHNRISGHLRAGSGPAKTPVSHNISTQTRDHLWELFAAGGRVERSTATGRPAYSIHD